MYLSYISWYRHTIYIDNFLHNKGSQDFLFLLIMLYWLEYDAQRLVKYSVIENTCKFYEMPPIDCKGDECFAGIEHPPLPIEGFHKVSYPPNSTDNALDEKALHIHCYEANRENIARLRQKLDSFAPHKIEIHESALWNSSGGKLYFEGQGEAGRITGEFSGRHNDIQIHMELETSGVIAEKIDDTCRSSFQQRCRNHSRIQILLPFRPYPFQVSNVSRKTIIQNPFQSYF